MKKRMLDALRISPRLSIISFYTILILLAVLINTAISETESRVYVIEIEGVIDPVTAEYINGSIEIAERNKAELLVIQMDTPGGLDISMRSIIRDMLNSRVPIIVYVSPAGARAASAGTFITLAGHIAAMAPGTNIGAAHPVTLQGELPEEVEKKAVNDAVAYIRGIAKKTGRNQNWAEDAVRNSVSITAEQALELEVIDYVVPSLETLLSKVDGREVETFAGSLILDTKDTEIANWPMSLRQRLLHALINPNIAYLLMILGFYGILYEIASPGFGLSGIAGVISLILGFYAVQVLSVNYAGLALLLLGVALLIAEAFTAGFGILGAGGIVSMAIGSLILFESPVAALRVSPLVVIPTVLTTAAFIIFAIRMVVKAQMRRPVTGVEGMIGQTAEVRKILEPEGEVFIRGELWKAESLEGVIERGEKVKVVDVDGLKLKVKRIE